MSDPTAASLYLWRADYEQGRAVCVEAPDGGYPASDADGIQIYDNSHFGAEEDAWADLFGHVAARIESAGDRLNEAEALVLAKREDCGVACQKFAQLRANKEHRELEVIKDGAE